MPEYLSPGVYVEEIETGAMPIEGAGTSTAGFLGETERGPTDPTPITSYSEFRRVFGGRAQWNFGDGERKSYLTYAIDGFFRNGGSRCFVARIVRSGSDRNPAVVAKSNLVGDTEVKASGPGSWGNNVLLKIEKSPIAEDRRFNLWVRYWYDEIPDHAQNPPDPPNKPTIKDPDLEERYTNLSLDKQSQDYYAKLINGPSDLIEITENMKEVPEPKILPLNEEQAGADGDEVDVSDFVRDEFKEETPSGNERIKRTGLTGFEEVNEIAIVCAPDENSINGLRDRVLEHCQNSEYRFAIFQAERGKAPKDLDDGLPKDALSDPGLGAFYYPWVKVLDPQTNVETLAPPGGHIAGLYARTDNERGVHKAPANEQLRGVQALEHDIRKEDQDGLNPKNINCIRSFPGRGIRVWGARTTSPKTIWRYVNVRRLFLYLGKSIDEGTQWAVFEPNDEKLWARIEQSVSNFLTGEWRKGALMGTTPEEAFYVKCDRSTMTQTDIDLGRLIVEIGVAPVKPAEFVIFRITQWTGGAEDA